MRNTVAATAILITCLVGQDKEPKVLRVPEWFALFEPKNQQVERESPEQFHLTYDSDSSLGSLVGHYESALHEVAVTGLTFDESGDRQGTTFKIIRGDIYCRMALSGQDNSHVDLSCSNTHYSEVLKKIETQNAVNGTPPAAQTGIHQVEYLIEGDCGSAGVTLRNAGGGTEQHDVNVPTKFTINAGLGTFLYISAQKKGSDGTVRVAIKVDGVIVRRSIATSAYGIASANGRL
jgi:hypothetical protein